MAWTAQVEHVRDLSNSSEGALVKWLSAPVEILLLNFLVAFSTTGLEFSSLEREWEQRI